METWQTDHIRKNLPGLLLCTSCNTSFLARLFADGIVSNEEVGNLRAVRNPLEQSQNFYEIIQTRKDSFNLLKQALKDTAQSGALDILDQCNHPSVPIIYKNCGNISYIREVLLGNGCYGTVVFKGKFENRDVAVKRLNRDLVNMIDVEKEVNLQILLDSHKNVVRYFKTEVSEDFIFIALELCDANLFDWVTQLQKTVEIGVIEIMKQTTEGVSHLHFHRVIHRDLKPTNILLVSRSVGDAQVKISDFGLSKRIPVGMSKLSGHTAGVGTVEWMAPEVAGGLGLQNNVAVGMSFASDVFSLGCVYYFVLSGGLHAFGEPRRCQANIMDGKYQLNEQNIASVEGDVSGLIKLISKMIAHERCERPTILEVLAWLPEVLSSKSVKVPTGQQNAIDGQSVKGKHMSGKIVDANPGNVGIVSAKKSKLMLENVNKQKGIQLTKFPPTVTTTPDVQLTKMEGTQEHKLHLAIGSGDMQAIQDLIQSGADVNAKNTKHETPLMIAAKSKVDGNITYDIVKFLINHGADAFEKNSEGQTFLHKFFLKTTTYESGFGALAQYLVDKKLCSLFNVQDATFGVTPLMLAARNVELDMATISLLRKNQVDLTLVDNIGGSYLSYVAEGNKNGKLLAELVKKGEMKHKKLAEAIQAMDGDSVKVLVSLGADVNETNDYSKTPLHLAAGRHKTFSINIIKFLIDFGANVDAKDEDGNIFLHLWVSRNTRINPTEFDDIATYLISKGLSRLFNTPGRDSDTPFQMSVKMVEIERATLSLLKNNGVDFNAANSVKNSVLLNATFGDRTLRMISDLVDLGANPIHLTIGNVSMLHIAAQNGNADVVKFFLDKGLDINAQNMRGETPLHYALSSVNKEAVFKTVQLLLQNGAKSDIVDKDGKSPRDYFNENRYDFSEANQISTCFSLASSC